MPALFSSGSGGQTDQQKQLTTAETDIAKFGLGEAKQNLPQARTSRQQPLNFFQALLSGDRNTILSALSPEVSTLTSQYDTGRKTAEEFAPRGGGRGAALEELPFRKASDIEQLVAGARATGAAGVTGIAQLLGNLGLGEVSAGTGAASAASENINTASAAKAQQQAQAGQAIGTLVALLVGA
jgi:hypothetical protein